MTVGAASLVAGVAAAVALSATEVVAWTVTGAVWALIGGGMALIVTLTGRVLRRSVEPDALPEVFAAIPTSHSATAEARAILTRLYWNRRCLQTSTTASRYHRSLY